MPNGLIGARLKLSAGAAAVLYGCSRSSSCRRWVFCVPRYVFLLFVSYSLLNGLSSQSLGLFFQKNLVVALPQGDIDTAFWEKNSGRPPDFKDNPLHHGVTRVSDNFNSWRSPWDTVSETVSRLFPFSSSSSKDPVSNQRSFGKKDTFRDTTVEWQLNDVNKYNISDDFGSLSGFGDFRSSKHTDLFFVSSTGKDHSLLVVAWNTEQKRFSVYRRYTFPNHVEDVEGLILVDFNLDGALDVAVVYRRSGSRWTTTATAFELFLLAQDADTHTLQLFWDTFLNTTHTQNKLVSPTTYPFIADINFDGYPDFVFQAKGSNDHQNGISELSGRYAWVNRKGKNFTLEPLDGSELRRFFIGSFHPSAEISSPHSSAFVDIDGDCVADLVFDVTKSSRIRVLEVWFARYVPDTPLSQNSQTSLNLVST